jgi:large subunit ribosomal protein L4
MIKVKVFDTTAKETGEYKLPAEFFEAKINPDLIRQAVYVHLNNQRKSHAKTKGRGEVEGTNQKMWAQKGTGRARHSTAKAPIFVGGGRAHGPRGDQNFSLKMTKKMRQAAIRSALSLFADKKSIIIIDKISQLSPKTKEAVKLITGLKSQNKVLSEGRKIGIITSSSNAKTKRAFGNLPKVKLLNLNSLNCYDLTKQDFILFTKKAVEVMAKSKK